MSKVHPENMAQFVDKLLTRTALGVALVAVAQVLSAAMHLVGEPLAATLDRIGLALGVATIVIVLPVFVRFLRMRLDSRCDCSQADSYIGAIFNKACVFAFSLMFVLVIALKATSGRPFADQPLAFFLSIIAAASLGVFSLVFFVGQRGDEPADEFE